MRTRRRTRSRISRRITARAADRQNATDATGAPGDRGPRALPGRKAMRSLPAPPMDATPISWRRARAPPRVFLDLSSATPSAPGPLGWDIQPGRPLFRQLPRRHPPGRWWCRRALLGGDLLMRSLRARGPVRPGSRRDTMPGLGPLVVVGTIPAVLVGSSSTRCDLFASPSSAAAWHINGVLMPTWPRCCSAAPRSAEAGTTPTRDRVPARPRGARKSGWRRRWRSLPGSPLGRQRWAAGVLAASPTRRAARFASSARALSRGAARSSCPSGRLARPRRGRPALVVGCASRDASPVASRRCSPRPTAYPRTCSWSRGSDLRGGDHRVLIGRRASAGARVPDRWASQPAFVIGELRGLLAGGGGSWFQAARPSPAGRGAGAAAAGG